MIAYQKSSVKKGGIKMLYVFCKNQSWFKADYIMIHDNSIRIVGEKDSVIIPIDSIESIQEIITEKEKENIYKELKGGF